MPFVEVRSLSHPLGLVDDPSFDYTYLETLAVNDSNEDWKKHFDWLREVDALPKNKPVEAIDMKPIFRNLTFADSQDEIGLQLADIVASAFHRACRGTLQQEGWQDLGSLFIFRKDDVVHYVALGKEVGKTPKDLPVSDKQVADVLLGIRRGARSMSAS